MNVYKRLANLIHNDLKITKEDILEGIDKVIETSVDKYLKRHEENIIDAIRKTVYNFAKKHLPTRYSMKSDDYFKDWIKNEIETIVREYVKEEFKNKYDIQITRKEEG
jgi:hypothetical protein